MQINASKSLFYSLLFLVVSTFQRVTSKKIRFSFPALRDTSRLCPGVAVRAPSLHHLPVGRPNLHEPLLRATSQPPNRVAKPGRPVDPRRSGVHQDTRLTTGQEPNRRGVSDAALQITSSRRERGQTVHPEGRASSAAVAVHGGQQRRRLPPPERGRIVIAAFSIICCASRTGAGHVSQAGIRRGTLPRSRGREGRARPNRRWGPGE